MAQWIMCKCAEETAEGGLVRREDKIHLRYLDAAGSLFGRTGGDGKISVDSPWVMSESRTARMTQMTRKENGSMDNVQIR